jgi:hypothetical protein
MRAALLVVAGLAAAAAFAPPRSALASPSARAAPRARDVSVAAAPGTAVVDKDFRLAGIFLGAGLLLDQIPYVQLVGVPITLLGVLFLVQTFRLDFCFDDDSFELKGLDGADTGENIVVGGANKWTYDSFVNWDTFPAGWIDQPQGPILIYFKETQTPSDQWNVGPGESANSPEAIAKGAVPGQVHFFPAICNAKQITAEFAKRGCKKL